MTINRHAKIYIAGHSGLVGTALSAQLISESFTNIITCSYHELDLRNQQDVNSFFKQEQPDYVFLLAARVGGIQGNLEYPAEFLYDNLMITSNVINAAYKTGVQKLLYMGSSCIYPRDCSQPIKEEYLLTGPLEKTNEPYALAKIAGLKLCQSYNQQYDTRFISCMPTNVYGINDTFDSAHGHVIPSLIAKFCQAQRENKSEVICWGTGSARREFIHARDLAKALVYLMDFHEDYGENGWINIGTGADSAIVDLVYLIRDLVGFKGDIVFDSTKPDGTPQKLLNSERIHSLGWRSSISLQEGLKEVIEWYKQLSKRRKKGEEHDNL